MVYDVVLKKVFKTFGTGNQAVTALNYIEANFT